MDIIEKIEPGEARCYHFFRSSITDYHNSQYKSLQAALHRLVSEGYLKRIKRGYYSIPKNKKNRRKRINIKKYNSPLRHQNINNHNKEI